MSEPAGPLTRPVLVTRLPPEGATVVVEATEAERSALAAEFGLPALHALRAELRVRGRHDRVQVTGRVWADLEQICVVSLDAFRSSIDEEVDVAFEEGRATVDRGRDEAGAEREIDPDEPDPIVEGRIDLGRLTAEFLALGLDPYPRKPGVSFEANEADGSDSPFARLAALKPRRE